MKSHVATLATTLLVCLVGGLAHGQAPCYYGPQQAPCNYAQCGQGEQVYLVLKPIHRSCEPSSHWLIGGNLFNNCKCKENCGCEEPKCSHARCNEPCHEQPCHEQPCYAQAPCAPCNEGRCNEGRCNEGRCNEGHFNHLSAGCYPVRVVPCAPGNQCAAPCNYGQPYGPPNGQPYYGPRAGGPTTAEPPVAETNAYIPLIQAIQAAQEKDNRAMREMMENRQATLSLVRAIQSSDASTVASFEKMLQQMKDTNTVRENGK